MNLWEKEKEDLVIEWLPGPGADAIPSVWFSAACVLLCWPGRVGPDLQGEPNSQQSLNIKPAEMEFHHAGTGRNPTEPAGKKMPQTVLRFPMCNIEIVTRCSLTHSYTHSLHPQTGSPRWTALKEYQEVIFMQGCCDDETFLLLHSICPCTS